MGAYSPWQYTKLNVHYSFMTHSCGGDGAGLSFILQEGT